MTYWEGVVRNEHDEQQAWASGDKENVEREVRHYLSIYSQEGPHTAEMREVGDWQEIK